MTKPLNAIIKKSLKIGEPETLSVGNFAPAGKKGKDWVANHKVQHNRYAVTDENDPRFKVKDSDFATSPTDPRLPSSVPLSHVHPDKNFNSTDKVAQYPSGVAEDLEEKKLKSFKEFRRKGDKIPNLDNSEGFPLEDEQFDENHFKDMDDEAKHWHKFGDAHRSHANKHYKELEKARKARMEKDENDYEASAKEFHHGNMARGHNIVARGYNTLAGCCKGKEPLYEDKDLYEADKHWIQGAIKHPGAEKNAAKRAGMSTHSYMEKHKHDSGKAGDRARLGLTLSKMHHKEEVENEEAMPIGGGKKEQFDSEIKKMKPGKAIGTQPFGGGGHKPVCEPKNNVKEGLSMPFGSGDGSLERLRAMAAKRDAVDSKIGSTPRGAGKPLVTDTASPEGKIGSVAFGAGKGGIGGVGNKDCEPKADAKIESTPFGAGTTLRHKAPGQTEETLPTLKYEDGKFIYEAKKKKESKKEDCDAKSPPIEGFQETVTGDCSKVVDDFVHSPKKKGNPLNKDSKKERIHRALGACYAAKRKGK